ncbi:MAG TPA: hypothetical protein VFL61_05400 [Gaiellaceae bacterium]|nr:hypothetical protein [Gaiellaceae bacterium]
MSEEELTALRAELARDAEARAGGERRGLQDPGPGVGVVADEHELLEPGDAQEGGRVGGVDHLASVLGLRSEEAIEVALRLWPEEQLRLLEQQHEPVDAGLVAALDVVQERERRRGR